MAEAWDYRAELWKQKIKQGAKRLRGRGFGYVN